MRTFTIFGAAVSISIMLVISTVVNGWALKILWAWFITPVFHLPGLSIAQAIGLALVVSFLTREYLPPKKNKYDEEESFSDKMVVAMTSSLFRPLFTLFFGWVVHRFA